MLAFCSLEIQWYACVEDHANLHSNLDYTDGICFWMQSMISRAHAEVKELRQSIQLLKAEGEKLEVKLYLIWYGSIVLQSL